MKTPEGMLNLTWARDKVALLKTVSMIKTIPTNGLIKIEMDIPAEAYSLNFEVRSLSKNVKRIQMGARQKGCSFLQRMFATPKLAKKIFQTLVGH